MQSEFIYTGNSSRFHQVIEKARRQEPIHLFFLGASITYGYEIKEEERFPAILCRYLQQLTGNSDIFVHNLSLPGMPSLHGLYLSYFELPKYKPDLIVIDYSVNDQKHPAYRDGFESLLVRCLNHASNPAVLSFFVRQEVGYTCMPHMAAVCRHYQIPFVDIGGWLTSDIEQGKMQWNDYSYDYCHPSSNGHQYIGTCLTKLLEVLAETPAVPEFFPEQAFYNRDPAYLHFYPDAWKHTSDSDTAPLIVDFSCRMLYLVYEVDITPDFGKAELFVDGSCFRVLDSYRIHEWDRPVQEILYLSRDVQMHHIELRIPKEDEQKHFSLLCLGFC